MGKVKKAFGWRKKIMTAVVSAAATSAVAYYWADIVRVTPTMVNKVLNRTSEAKQPQRVPAIFTTFQKND